MFLYFQIEDSCDSKIFRIQGIKTDYKYEAEYYSALHLLSAIYNQYSVNNIVMFLLGLQVLNPQISPLFKFTFLQVVWPNRGGGFGEIFVTSEIKTMPDIQITKDTKIL